MMAPLTQRGYHPNPDATSTPTSEPTAEPAATGTSAQPSSVCRLSVSPKEASACTPTATMTARTNPIAASKRNDRSRRERPCIRGEPAGFHSLVPFTAPPLTKRGPDPSRAPPDTSTDCPIRSRSPRGLPEPPQAVRAARDTASSSRSRARSRRNASPSRGLLRAHRTHRA